MNAIITEAEFRKRLQGPVSGCYVFYGEEDYLKAYCIKAARERICPDEGLACFNDITVDFQDFSVESLTDALAAPPMMCDCKMVTVRSFDFGAIKPSEVEGLLALMGAYRDDPSNLLILSVIPEGVDMGYAKKPSALCKKLLEVSTPVHFEASTPARLASWAVRHFKHESIDVDERTARFLVDYCGKSMYALSSEIEKLCAYLHGKGRTDVKEEDIRAVSVPEESCDAFALTDALLAGDRAAALSALSVMRFRQVEPGYVLAEISQTFCFLYQVRRLSEGGMDRRDIGKVFRPPLHEYRVEKFLAASTRHSEASLTRAIELCADADLAMKSYGKRNYEQIEKLVCLL